MTTTTKILPLVLGLFLGACVFGCAAETEPGGNQPGSGTSPTQPPAGNASSTPDYEISCMGEIKKQSVAVTLAPLCVGGPPGTFGTLCDADPCAPQEIAIRYEPPATRCGSIDLFAWDGKACVKHPTNEGGTMHCKGTDCEKLFKTEADCKAAYASCTGK